MKSARPGVVVHLCVALMAGSGCGMVGPPIPPEDVGVAPLIERQKKQRAQAAGQERSVTEGDPNEGRRFIEPRGQDEELPPLRPVGTR